MTFDDINLMKGHNEQNLLHRGYHKSLTAWPSQGCRKLVSTQTIKSLGEAGGAFFWYDNDKVHRSSFSLAPLSSG